MILSNVCFVFYGMVIYLLFCCLKPQPLMADARAKDVIQMGYDELLELDKTMLQQQQAIHHIQDSLQHLHRQRDDVEQTHEQRFAQLQRRLLGQYRALLLMKRCKQSLLPQALFQNQSLQKNIENKYLAYLTAYYHTQSKQKNLHILEEEQHLLQQLALMQKEQQTKLEDIEQRQHHYQILKNDYLQILKLFETQRQSKPQLAEEDRQQRLQSQAALQRLLAQGRLHGVQASFVQGLPWPVGGRLRRLFGESIDPVYGTRTRSQGVELLSKEAEEVRAIASGRVLYTGAMAALGQVMICEHGEGYHSVIAHFAEIWLEEGSAIVAGQPLGLAGYLDAKTPGIYLEIRHHGLAIDPQQWLR